MKPPGFIPSGRNEVVIRIYSYQENCPQGTISGPRISAPASFASLMQMLAIMERMMDQAKTPQRGEETRTFQHTEARRPAAERAPGEKPLATFHVNVLFRQNASWQGMLLWADKGMDAQFRSVLEMIGLMDSALTSDAA